MAKEGFSNQQRRRYNDHKSHDSPNEDTGERGSAQLFACASASVIPNLFAGRIYGQDL
jgi:hypothetical protein